MKNAAYETVLRDCVLALMLIPQLGFAKDVECARFSQQECTKSNECTLVGQAQDTGYSCRPAENECERGFSQDSGTKEICEARAGCEFVPGYCYCPPKMVCICGGGPPSQCKKKTIEEPSPA